MTLAPVAANTIVLGYFEITLVLAGDHTILIETGGADKMDPRAPQISLHRRGALIRPAYAACGSVFWQGRLA